MGIRKLQIVSKADGHRRCGMPHAGTKVYPVDAFTASQRKELEADRLLVVTEIEVPEDSAGDESKGRGKGK